MKDILKKIVVWVLTIESRLVLWKYKPKIVVVTGTVGKTSTKDAVFAVFKENFYTRASQKSFNSELGVPLTILDLPNEWNSAWGWSKNILLGFLVLILPNHYPKWLIMEIGTDKPGDVKSIAKWLRPDVVVATQFADIPVHVEFFDSPEEVIEEEQSIVFSLKKGGVLIANNDDPHTEELRKKLDCKVISFGMSEKAGVTASHIETLYEFQKPIGIRFRADYEEMSGPVTIMGSLGVQHVYPVLASLAAGISQNLNIVKTSRVFDTYQTPAGRMRIIHGTKDSTIIDDSYNSSPVALEKALETLGDLETSGRKISVLGDMKELGKYAKKEHERLGELAGRVSDTLVFVGEHSRDFSTGALKTKIKKENIVEFDTSLQAAFYLEKHLKKGDTVLVKGSQSIRLEKVVKSLMKNPENAGKLLVRQESEWTKR